MSGGLKSTGMAAGLGGLAFAGAKKALNPSSSFSAENNLMKYLNSQDTTNADQTASNLSSSALELSKTLGNRPDYVYSVDGSDDARKRMEDSVYNQAMDRLNPQFDRQRSSLETRLQNQGLAVGSQAYQRAMKDMDQSQNDATTNAAYSSIGQGQNSFSQSLADALSSGNFTNSARQMPLAEIAQMLQYAPTGYDKAMDIYALQKGMAQQKSADKQAGIGNMMGLATTGASLAAMLSDERLKENIKPVGRLDNGLRVYLFNYIGDDTPQIGLIAQEVSKVIPEAVVETDDGYLAVRYGLAVKGVKQDV